MIKFKIDGEQYFLPDVMNIEQYVKIYKVKDLFTDEDNYLPAKLVSMVSDAPINILLEAEYEDISFLASHVLSLLPNKDNVPFVDRFELNGIHYGFFPNWKDLTFAEFIDLDTISTKKPEELLDMLHILAAIMYRPIIEEKSEHNFKIEEYNVETMKERSELFKKQLNINYLIGAQFFFIKFANKFSSYTLPSLTKNLSIWNQIRLIWIMWRMIFKMTSNQRLGGTLSLTESLRMILQNTKSFTKKM